MDSGGGIMKEFIIVVVIGIVGTALWVIGSAYIKGLLTKKKETRDDNISPM